MKMGITKIARTEKNSAWTKFRVGKFSRCENSDGKATGGEIFRGEIT